MTASSQCRTHGGGLVSINSPNEAYAVNRMLQVSHSTSRFISTTRCELNNVQSCRLTVRVIIRTNGAIQLSLSWV